MASRPRGPGRGTRPGPSNQGENVRRSICAIALVTGVGILSALGPVAGATTGTRTAAAVGSPGQFGLRLVDVPVSEANNPRALRYIIDDLPTGTIIHRRILIVNNEPRKARFTVYPAAAHITGGLFVGDSGATPNELTTWTSVQHPSVTLAAGASTMDTVTIKVPKHATRGEHYGVVWVQQTSKPRSGSGFGVTEVSRVGVRMYLAVSRGGIPPTKFEITSITGRWLASGQPLIVAHVKNTGGRAVDLNGTVRLVNGPGHTSSGPFPAQKIVTLAPGQSYDLTFAPPKTLPLGSWKATGTLVSGLTKASGTATVQLMPVAATQSGLSAMQWIWVSLAGLATALVLVMGRYALRHRRSRLPA
jgi:hypothetical protein